MCSTRSRSAGSAQWTSSTTRTSGRSCASASNNRRIDQKTSSAESREDPTSSAPAIAATRSVSSPSTVARPRARSTVSSFEAMSPRPSTRRTGSTIGANELAPDGTQRASSTVARSLSKRRDPRTRGGSSRVRATRGRSRGGPDRRRPLRRRPRPAAQDRPRVRRRKSSPSSAGRCLRQVASRRPALPCPSSRGEERAPPGGGRGRSDRSRYP